MLISEINLASRLWKRWSWWITTMGQVLAATLHNARSYNHGLIGHVLTTITTMTTTTTTKKKMIMPLEGILFNIIFVINLLPLINNFFILTYFYNSINFADSKGVLVNRFVSVDSKFLINPIQLSIPIYIFQIWENFLLSIYVIMITRHC